MGLVDWSNHLGYYRFVMIVLAADTSTSFYSVAVCDGDRVLGEVSVDGGRKHSERLLDTMGWVLKQCGLGLSDVELLGISRGPGSFTGLRVGVSTWKGLALGAGLPLVGVSTLDAMGRLFGGGDGVVCPLLDARMGEVFGAVYEYRDGSRERLREERVCEVEELLEGLEGRVWFLGEGAKVYRERIQGVLPGAEFVAGDCSFPRASAVAMEVLAAVEGGASTEGADVRPVYLRKSQAEENRAGLAKEASRA